MNIQNLNLDPDLNLNPDTNPPFQNPEPELNPESPLNPQLPIAAHSPEPGERDGVRGNAPELSLGQQPRPSSIENRKSTANWIASSKTPTDLAKTFDQVRDQEQSLRTQLDLPGCPAPADPSGDSEINSLPTPRLDLPPVEPQFTRIDFNAVKPVEAE